MSMIRTATAFAFALVPAVALAAGLAWSAPQGWQEQKPASSMRVAQFTLPHAPGDAADGELVVYYFGGEGGGVEANIQRWIGQMQHPPAPPKRETKTVHGLEVTLLDVSGTYSAAMMPGAAEHRDDANYRMRAAVVDTPRGPYFIKLVGPEKTIAKWASSFDAFVNSLHYQS
jgi:hypothetical protein